MAIRKTSVDNYMVRIYRRGQGQSLVGVVELPVREKQVPFQKFEELQAILMREVGTAALTTQEPGEA